MHSCSQMILKQMKISKDISQNLMKCHKYSLNKSTRQALLSVYILAGYLLYVLYWKKTKKTKKPHKNIPFCGACTLNSFYSRQDFLDMTEKSLKMLKSFKNVTCLYFVQAPHARICLA